MIDTTVGSRTVKYNDQAADSRTGAVLLNIIRAAHAMPLQFTTLQTLTHGSNIQGTMGTQSGSNIQVPLNHLANQAPRVATFSPQIALGGNMQGTSSGQVATLNTQEFYQGLQKPFTKEQLHYYLTGNWQLETWQLFTLFISAITLDKGNGETLKLIGHADKEDNYRAFTGTLWLLARNGLTIDVKPAGKAVAVGPELESDQVPDRLLAALVTSSTAEKTGLTLTCDKKEEPAGPVEAYGAFPPDVKKCQLQKPAESTYQFCFAPTRDNNKSLWLETRKPLKKGDKIPIPLFQTERDPAIDTFTITEKNSCSTKQKEDGAGSGAETKKEMTEKLKFEIRSLEGIFYFLGEMVRTELGLGIDETPTSLAEPLKDERGEYTFRLFSVKTRRPSKGEIGVKYKGQWFSVEVDPTGTYNSSSRVLQIVADLLALQSKAKDLPASNVLTIAN